MHTNVILALALAPADTLRSTLDPALDATDREPTAWRIGTPVPPCALAKAIPGEFGAKDTGRTSGEMVSVVSLGSMVTEMVALAYPGALSVRVALSLVKE